ncbi:hypothetical protein [Paludibaculum fermentans]|uniref:Uncharacterized protein n=1 Tax=Paludibaculum fermentans TaxID=1473598 RepID=A0A7S7NY08_PALFE|nr:hypothetical protein [Paludibaculum fermentans]QOY91845.1 hypothetical protein IRI77_18455 [Paludibaculum fermentans]
MKSPLYTLYGIVLLGMVSVGQWTGLSMSSINEVKNIPKSVRENPGVYRSHYGYLPHWFGGK